MKIYWLAVSGFFLFLFFSCSGAAERRIQLDPVPVPRVTPEGAAAYRLTLPPGGFVILTTSNYTRPLVNTNSQWWHDAVFYQVFSQAYNNGDLPTSRLSYLSNVGFDALWTTPIFASPSSHGYDTTDYKKIKASFGGQVGWKAYRAEAKRTGVRLILDLVLNHCSSRHPWFQDAERSKNGKKEWFIWKKKIPEGWQRPWGGGRSRSVWHYSNRAKEYFYGAFWRGMPDLNFKNPQVTREAYSIARHWLKEGAAGFRFDAARYLLEDGPYPQQADRPATLQWWRGFHQTLGRKNNFYSVGEVWVDDLAKVSAYYDRGRTIRQVFDFSFYSALIGTLQSGSPQRMIDHIRKLKASGVPLHFFAPFLDNHDNVFRNYRLMDALAGPGKSDPALAKSAACMLLMFSGTPFVYYGTEIGMNRGPQRGDRAKRTVMDWAEAGRQLVDKDSLLMTYRRLIRLRKQEPALRRGDLVSVKSAGNRFLAWLRPGPDRSVLVVVNPGRQEHTDTLDLRAAGFTGNRGFEMNAYPVGAGIDGGERVFRK